MESYVNSSPWNQGWTSWPACPAQRSAARTWSAPCVLPSPSCPSSFSPQAYTSPASVHAMLCPQPAATPDHFEAPASGGRGMSVGAGMLGAAAPVPHWPAAQRSVAQRGQGDFFFVAPTLLLVHFPSPLLCAAPCSRSLGKGRATGREGRRSARQVPGPALRAMISTGQRDSPAHTSERTRSFAARRQCSTHSARNREPLRERGRETLPAHSPCAAQPHVMHCPRAFTAQLCRAPAAMAATGCSGGAVDVISRRASVDHPCACLAAYLALGEVVR